MDDPTKIDKAGEVLRLAADMSEYYYREPLIITYSGGKDSDVLLHLARRFLTTQQIEVSHSVTTVDAPQTNRHVNKVFKDCEAAGIKTFKTIPHYKGKPINMWELIVEKSTVPTRMARFCCATFKETSRPNHFIATGVRESESTGRKGRDVFTVKAKTKSDAQFYSLEHVAEVFEESKESGAAQGLKPNDTDVWDCRFIENAKKKKDLIAHPIYEWNDHDVWDYIHENNIETNPLYEMGYTRVGCVGCPMASHRMRLKEFADFPHVKAQYMKAFERMLIRREEKGLPKKWKDAQDVFDWWIEKDKHELKGQMSINDYGEL